MPQQLSLKPSPTRPAARRLSPVSLCQQPRHSLAESQLSCAETLEALQEAVGATKAFGEHFLQELRQKLQNIIAPANSSMWQLYILCTYLECGFPFA